MNQVIRNRLIDIKKIGKVNLLKTEMYGLCSSIFLSKELFKHNKDIIGMLEYLNIEMKDYILRSRTLVIAHLVRSIEKASEEEILGYIEKMYEYLEINEDTKKNNIVSGEENIVSGEKKLVKKSKKSNEYFAKMINKYSRGNNVE